MNWLSAFAPAKSDSLMRSIWLTAPRNGPDFTESAGDDVVQKVLAAAFGGIGAENRGRL
jgi:hypothetical protein